MTEPILPEGTNVTFADYFELNVPIEDILAEFSVSFRLLRYELPRQEVDQDLVDELTRRFDRPDGRQGRSRFPLRNPHSVTDLARSAEK